MINVSKKYGTSKNYFFLVSSNTVQDAHYKISACNRKAYMELKHKQGIEWVTVQTFTNDTIKNFKNAAISELELAEVRV